MIRVKLKGADDFTGDCFEAGDRLIKESRDLETELADDAASKARNKARSGKLTGASMESIRAYGPTVVAGEGVPWYGFADFGGRVGIRKSVKRQYKTLGRWLFPALSEIGVMRRAEKALDDATKELR